MAKETFERSKPIIGVVTPPQGQVIGAQVVLAAGVLVEATLFIDVPDTAGYYWIAYVSPPMAPGVMSVPPSRLKMMQSYPIAAADGEIVMLTEFSARYGTPQLGSKVFIRSLLIDSASGYSWDMGTTSAIVTGT